GAASNPEELLTCARKRLSLWANSATALRLLRLHCRFSIIPPMPLPVELPQHTTSVRRRMMLSKIMPICAALGAAIFSASCADFRHELTARAQRLPDFFPSAATSEGYWR